MSKKIFIGAAIALSVAVLAFLVVLNNNESKISKTNSVDNATQALDTSSKKQADGKPEKLKCVNDTDCEFVFTKMENSCVTCSYASEDWQCMDKASAKKEWNKWTERHKNILCERCLDSETDFDKFECKCMNNSCVKSKK